MRSTGTILTLGIVSLCWVAALSASVVDNRFFPLFTQVYFRKVDPIGTVDGDFFVMTGKEARNHRRDAVHMPEIYGKYDLSQVSHGLETVLGVNYVKPEWQAAKDLIATMEGKLQAPGLHLGCERRLYEALSIGIQLDLMHVSSRIDFLVAPETTRQLKLDQGGTAEFQRAVSATNRALGLDADQWTATGLSDTDVYLRLARVRDYVLKCRQVDAGIKFGTYLPTGVLRDLDNPASVPFGGNGHFGLYVEGEINLELKEDWFLGFWTQFVYRFAKEQTLRLPAANALFGPAALNFGALTGAGKVYPGATFCIAPYAAWRDIQNGFGGRLAYTYRQHASDSWLYLRADKSVPSNLALVSDLTAWTSEYLTVGFVYSWRSVDDARADYVPMLYLNWDQPVDFFNSDQGAVQTHRASLGIEVDF
ncbi:MAG TPA: hypothetical protein VJJ83_04055 [Candidatus Babeliales bacterium]|nr:hypothetical protein [Candidatus Babeliales bacterium]